MVYFHTHKLMNDQANDSYLFKTLPELLTYVANHFRTAHQLCYPVAGRWKHYSTEYVLETVRRQALGLRAIGLQRGDTVGLLANSSPWWLIMDLAIMVAGGVTVPIFPRISLKNFGFQVANAGIKYLVIMGQDQWPVYQKSEERFEAVITHEVSKGALKDSASYLSWDELTQRGDDLSDTDPHLYAELLKQIKPSDLATIIYTSGSTGVPKGVELTQANLVSQVKSSITRCPLNPRIDRAFSGLPLAHIYERMVVYYYLGSGVSIYFADDVRNLRVLLVKSRPTTMTMVPRIVEKLYSRLQNGIDSGPPLKRFLGRWAINLAQSPRNGFLIRLQRRLADKLVYKKLRAALGGELRFISVGGASLDKYLCQFFWNIGVRMYQGYGLTESSPVLCTNFPGHNKCGTVGLPFPGCTIKISPQGEILAQGPNIMRGYHKNEEATKKAIDTEGWLHTGDLGHIDEEGYLIVTGRLKEVMKTSGGKMVAPVPIEQKFCQSMLIDMAMVVAEDRNYVTCLFFPDFDVLREWKIKKKQSHVSHEVFLESDEVRRYMEDLICEVNSSLNRWEKVRKYRFVSHPVSIEGGELTPTLKIRRGAVIRKYAELIESMYQETGESLL